MPLARTRGVICWTGILGLQADVIIGYWQGTESEVKYPTPDSDLSKISDSNLSTMSDSVT